eukprot:9348531-Lingulodinium_polyedra.AAC.1
MARQRAKVPLHFLPLWGGGGQQRCARGGSWQSKRLRPTAFPPPLGRGGNIAVPLVVHGTRPRQKAEAVLHSLP